MIKNWRSLTFSSIEHFGLTPFVEIQFSNFQHFEFFAKAKFFSISRIYCKSVKFLNSNEYRTKQVLVNPEFRDMDYSLFCITHVIIITSY